MHYLFFLRSTGCWHLPSFVRQSFHWH